MKAILLNIASGWNFIKIIRVIAGLLILISGIEGKNTPFILIGVIFLLLSLVAPGACCAMYNPPVRQNKTIGETEYEEVGVK